MPGRSVTSVSAWPRMTPSLAIDCHAGKVADVLVRAGQLVEQGWFLPQFWLPASAKVSVPSGSGRSPALTW